MFVLRALIVNEINDDHPKYVRSYHMSDTPIESIDNLTYCIDDKLISFVLKGKNDELIITRYNRELKASRRDEDLVT